jgi:hypothetical protein
LSPRPIGRRARLASIDLPNVAQGFDASKDQVDAGDELLAVVMFAQLHGDVANERMPCGIELRPSPCDRLQGRCAIHGSIENAGYQRVSGGEGRG